MCYRCYTVLLQMLHVQNSENKLEKYKTKINGLHLKVYVSPKVLYNLINGSVSLK